MPRIPIEDNFTDVIAKAQRGLRISDAELCKRAEVSHADLAAVKSGEPIDAVIRRVARHLRLGPASLEELAHRRWYPEAPVFPHGFAVFNTLYEDMAVNSYLVWDARAKTAAAFDTGADCGGMLDLVRTERLRLQMIFLTHTHDDHVADLPRLARETGAEVWASEREPSDHPGARVFKENAHFHLGDVAIKTLSTWGHSPGQTTYYVTGLSYPLAVVGDSLFACSIGGSPAHFADQYKNDVEKILRLPRNTVLACGHGPLTTVAQEKRHNPFFASSCGSYRYVPYSTPMTPARILRTNAPVSMKRKTTFILVLAFALIMAWVLIITDEQVREHLGGTLYIIGFAITGCMLLILAGYVWDQTLAKSLKSLHDTTDSVQIEDMPLAGDESDSDEIIGLARKIERMARSLQQVEASYKGIVEDQPDLICRYKNDGKITFVNGAYARAVNRKRTELAGVDFPYFAPGAAIADEPYTFESEMVFSDGRRLWIRWTQRAIKDDERNTMEYQAVGHDITERKEAEAALLRAKEAAEAADRAKSEFLAIVSHELRTPINAIIGFSKMLSSTTLNLDQREQVEMINSSGLALEKIIADILNLSKIDSGKIDIEHAPFSLRNCVQDICAFFAMKARSLALGLDSKVDAGVPEIVNSDESRIRQILTNLIGNALKFTERGGVSLEVSCARGEPIDANSNRRVARLFFAVKDSGIGIPADKLDHLFLPFSQVDTSSTRRRGGTGLGLIISKRLCELMGGTISVESHVSEGSTFRFSILTDFEEA